MQFSPILLFDLFFTPEVIDSISKEANEYAAQQDKEKTFYIDVLALKLFIPILIISGYSPLPRRSMFSEASGDIRNETASGAMFQSRLSSIIRNIHNANNNTLDPKD